jgi:hypothetical protein
MVVRERSLALVPMFAALRKSASGVRRGKAENKGFQVSWRFELSNLYSNI